jgi:hypothetical protein
MHHGKHSYRCPARNDTVWGTEKCEKDYVNGEMIEEAVWEQMVKLLTNPQLVTEEAERARCGVSETMEALERENEDVKRRLRQTYEQEAHYAGLNADRRLSGEAYDRLSAQLRAQRTWCTEESERLKRGKATLQGEVEAVANLQSLIGRVNSKLDRATGEEKRMVLEALHTRVRVKPDGSIELCLHVPASASIVSHHPEVT